MSDVTDQRIVIPVDAAARQLIVFEAPAHGYVSGWAIVWNGDSLYDENDIVVRLRFGLADRASETSALVVRELYLTTGELPHAQAPTGEDPDREISGRLLRNVPLGKFEAAVNTAPARALLNPVLKVSSGFKVTPWPDGKKFDTSDPESPPWWLKPPKQPAATPTAHALELDIPKGYGRPDSFYQAVAAVYSQLATSSSRPANELAEANDVPVTTVHGWVKEARKRGFLPARSTRRGGSR